MGSFDHIDISNEKVQKIVKASFEVFTLNDLNKASTNMIVKKAGVSRGILYHYFKDKEELFDYLNFFSFEKNVYEMDRFLNWDNDDIIERLSNITKLRLDILAEYPYMIEFGEKYKDLIFKFADADYLHKWRSKFYSFNVDYSRFKDESNIKETLHIVKWTYRGLYMELLKAQTLPIDESVILRLKDECDKYYEMLAKSFYK